MKCEKGCGEGEILGGRAWVVAALRKKILKMVGEGEDFRVCALNERVDATAWSKIKDYMYYIQNDEDCEGGFDFYGDGYRGWATNAGEKVAEILAKYADEIANKIEREKAKILDERAARAEKKAKVEIEREKRAEEKKARDEDAAEKRIERKKRELEKLEMVGDDLDWDLLRKLGCKHNNVCEMKEVTNECYGSIYSHREFAIYEDECTGLTIVFDKLNADYWQWAMYATKASKLYEKLINAKKELVQERAIEYVNEPDAYLIAVLLDSDENYDNESYKFIARDDQLKQQAIENYKHKMTSENKYLTSLDEENLKKLGIFDDVKKEIKKAKVKKQNELKQKQRKTKKKIEIFVKTISDKLKVESYDENGRWAKVRIKYIQDRAEFDRVVSAIKEKGGKFNWSDKTWSVDIHDD